ncbi:MAG: hypothetical protein KGN76_09340 [Acidobacteriota bacterium]|nr:hypothetical protein [Acidobacteriota bacterium]
MSSPRLPRLVPVVLAVALLASYAYFYQAGGWNQNSRFALIDAITETGSLQIDPFHHHTGDLAVWQGHYYSDKAPGDALAAVPAVWATGLALRAAGVDPGSYRGETTRSYVATVVTAGLGILLAAGAIWWLGLEWGAGDGGAIFAALAFGLATPAWCYATLMFGHSLAAGGLAVALAAAVALRRADTPRAQIRCALLVGLAAGWATVTEFPAAVPAAVLALLALWEAWPRGGAARRRVFVAVTAGALACAAVLLAYNRAAFGSAFHIGYESEQRFPGMQEGFFGITTPDHYALNQILFGQYRGLLPIAPILALAPVLMGWLWYRRPEARKALVAGALIVVYYVLLNASYQYWDGGWAFGPRHLVPALPFLCLGFALAWRDGGRFGRALLAALFLYGAAVSLVAVSTTPQPPADYRKPLTQLLLPAFLHGELGINHQSFLVSAEPAPLLDRSVKYWAWNVGQLAGLPGLASLLPLLFVWIGAGGLSWWAVLRAPRDRQENAGRRWMRALAGPRGTMGPLKGNVRT